MFDTLLPKRGALPLLMDSKSGRYLSAVAAALTTNSPSLSRARLASDVPVPAPRATPPSARGASSPASMIGRVRAPEIVSNLCFGGPRRNRLYITARTSLYAIYLNTHAANWIAA